MDFIRCDNEYRQMIWLTENTETETKENFGAPFFPIIFSLYMVGVVKTGSSHHELLVKQPTYSVKISPYTSSAFPLHHNSLCTNFHFNGNMLCLTQLRKSSTKDNTLFIRAWKLAALFTEICHFSIELDVYSGDKLGLVKVSFHQSMCRVSFFSCLLKFSMRKF